MAAKSAKSVAAEMLEDWRVDPPICMKLNRENAMRFITLCELADKLVADFPAEGILIELEDAAPHGLICVDLNDMVFYDGASHYFFKDIKSADMIGFKKMKGEVVRINLGVKDILIKDE